MNNFNFIVNCVEHEKCFITLDSLFILNTIDDEQILINIRDLRLLSEKFCVAYFNIIKTTRHSYEKLNIGNIAVHIAALRQWAHYLPSCFPASDTMSAAASGPPYTEWWPAGSPIHICWLCSRLLRLYSPICHGRTRFQDFG